MTLRNRLSVAAALLVLIVVAAVSSVLYLFYAASLHSRLDATLVDTTQQASGIIQRIKESGAASESEPDFSRPISVGGVQVQLLLRPVAGQSTLFGPLDRRDIEVAQQTQPAYLTTVRQDGRQYRVYTAALPGNVGGLVRTGQAANADDSQLRRAATLLAALTILAAGTTYGTARLTAGRLLRPIADLTAAAEHITETRDPTAHLGFATDRDDEVGRLAASFATMLGVLHDSHTAQRQLIADASHELRTPLTSLSTNLDLLEDGAGVADPQAPALVRAAREQATELSQLITDLLDLARYHETAPHRETVSLDQLTGEAVHRIRQRSPHADITTDLQPCLVYADPASIDHAITNLIDNAIKWTPPGGVVHVAVAAARASVTDHGPGINDDDLPRIFERFYRAPTAQGKPGAGLGLAIVSTIAHANNGAVEVRTGPTGSTFTLTLPAAPPDVPAAG
jgi:two-component system, OmpR family, sensor histidine kinase MprB